MEDLTIANEQITASSVVNSSSTASNGRLHFPGGELVFGSWTSEFNNSNQWLQVDFHETTYIAEILSQGRQDYDEWVKSYFVSSSDDGVNFYYHNSSWYSEVCAKGLTSSEIFLLKFCDIINTN